MISKAFNFGIEATSCLSSLFAEAKSVLTSSTTVDLEEVEIPLRNHELALIFAREILELGLGSNILESRRRASGGNQLGHL